VKLLRPRVIAEAAVLPFLSLGGYLLWYEIFLTDSPRYCDAPVPVGLGLLLFMGPVVEVIRVADRRRMTGRAALLGLAVGVVAAVLVLAAATHLYGRSCWT
jgi:hypothetical protein